MPFRVRTSCSGLVAISCSSYSGPAFALQDCRPAHPRKTAAGMPHSTDWARIAARARRRHPRCGRGRRQNRGRDHGSWRGTRCRPQTARDQKQVAPKIDLLRGKPVAVRWQTRLESANAGIFQGGVHLVRCATCTVQRRAQSPAGSSRSIRYPSPGTARAWTVPARARATVHGGCCRNAGTGFMAGYCARLRI